MYLALAQIAHSWGLLGLCLGFALAVAYAAWPGNRAQFDHASRAPLEEDDDVRA